MSTLDLWDGPVGWRNRGFDLGQGGRERWGAELDVSGVRGFRGPVRICGHFPVLVGGQSWYKN